MTLGDGSHRGEHKIVLSLVPSRFLVDSQFFGKMFYASFLNCKHCTCSLVLNQTLGSKKISHHCSFIVKLPPLTFIFGTIFPCKANPEYHDWMSMDIDWMADWVVTNSKTWPTGKSRENLTCVVVCSSTILLKAACAIIVPKNHNNVASNHQEDSLEDANSQTPCWGCRLAKVSCTKPERASTIWECNAEVTFSISKH